MQIMAQQHSGHETAGLAAQDRRRRPSGRMRMFKQILVPANGTVTSMATAVAISRPAAVAG